jgi:hypothetical protein
VEQKRLEKRREAQAQMDSFLGTRSSNKEAGYANKYLHLFHCKSQFKG